MRFYFPDSQDQIDPDYDFINEKHPPHHVRQRDDRYAHEVLAESTHDGLLVSKAIVDGVAGGSAKYTIAQRRRLYDQGAERFFRLKRPSGRRLESVGDCGAFSYVNEAVPPISTMEAIDFYEGCGFDAGISVDHIILGFRSDLDQRLPLDDEAEELTEWKQRQAITLELAEEFLWNHRRRKCRFEPIGCAQGWSQSSYADAVGQLQRMGYGRVAVGGMVQLKTPQILEVLRSIEAVRTPATQLHLLGVTRPEEVHSFKSFGVTSFDSTSPFRRAFMDDTVNYWTFHGHYTALRVPPVGGNVKMERAVKSGELDQNAALDAEQECLHHIRAYDAGEVQLDDTLKALQRYYDLLGRRNRGEAYQRTLADRPWRGCACGICGRVGVEVAIFRGSERNKRRGFHNVAVFAQRLGHHLKERQNA